MFCSKSLLNLNSYVVGDEPSRRAGYRLYAVSNHFGTQSGGHCTFITPCLCKYYIPVVREIYALWGAGHGKAVNRTQRNPHPCIGSGVESRVATSLEGSWYRKFMFCEGQWRPCVHAWEFRESIEMANRTKHKFPASTPQYREVESSLLCVYADTACCLHPYTQTYYNFDDHEVREATAKQVKVKWEGSVWGSWEGPVGGRRGLEIQWLFWYFSFQSGAGYLLFYTSLQHQPPKAKF